MASDPAPIFAIPLFPLHLVLFPHSPLQLHIFEERYKAMISACIERDQPFGVVLIAEGQEVGTSAVPHEIGCVARILGIKRLEDGRMNLLAVGESRFRVLEYSLADEPYLVGRVESIEDTPWVDTESDKPMREIHRLFRQYLRLLSENMGIQLPEVPLSEDPTLLGFCVAAFSQISTHEKQKLLSMTDPQARLKLEKRLLRQQIKELQEIKSEGTNDRPDAAPGLRVVIAEPIRPTSAFWTEYRREARN